MAILVSADTRVVVWGMTGYQGQFHTARMLEFGTRVVAGVTPGKGGQTVHGVPVFETGEEAVRATGGTAACLFVPARFAREAALEAIELGMDPVVIITEGIPVQDTIQIVDQAQRRGVRVVGPNGPGLAAPGRCKIGIMPNSLFLPGPVGVVSRSGTLTYEIVASLTRRGIGQSTAVGLGGDPVVGMSFTDALQLFETDPQTRAVVLIGEIGGSAEEEAAAFIRSGGMSKPAVAYIAGRTAPPGKRMGHAGAVISGTAGTAASKVEALQAAGVRVAALPTAVADLVAGHL
ncbi:MAG: succinate--CoA ligase subunit alpha [Armatimonadota bacterium]|nr:succinate--CoA ligase subunit alpha [Armatimonadota bacterium]MDR7401850.1 succinate--CoA ligase subunit alpha [Armatimonadota bacterium]MDR7403920.1 succinate--CoA ligase subunit alpha [Armatimonadota bacterium]MDR7437434.1 succinate--CoA ligase subunit alpha [Armatimonadota bacterium]MDR7473185.1 succinate--CoA ligase subunit alpha [Armatimonadota bacterium]